MKENEALKPILGEVWQIIENFGKKSQDFQDFSFILRNLMERNAYFTVLFDLLLHDAGFDEREWRRWGPEDKHYQTWDEILGEWETVDGRVISHKRYFYELELSLKRHEAFLNQFENHIKKKGILDYYSLVPEELDDSSRYIHFWREEIKKLGTPKKIIDALHWRERRVNRRIDYYLKEDQAQITAAYLTVVALPVGWLSLKATGAYAAAAGISRLKATAWLFGLPLGVGALEGTGHFFYKVLKNGQDPSIKDFFNEFIPEICEGAQWSLMVPFLGVAGGAVANKFPRYSKYVLPAIIGINVMDITLQSLEGVSKMFYSDTREEGALLIMDSALHLASFLLLAKVMGPSFNGDPSQPHSIQRSRALLRLLQKKLRR